jgi:hypothetical protein
LVGGISVTDRLVARAKHHDIAFAGGGGVAAGHDRPVAPEAVSSLLTIAG